MTSCSSGDDDGPDASAAPQTTLPPILTTEQCVEAASDAVVPLQSFVDQYDDLTVEEWNELDPPPDLAEVQEEVVAIAQSAVDRGCYAPTMEELLAEGIDELDGRGEVGRSIAASLRGDGPFLGPPEPVITTTVPRNAIPTTVTLEVGESLPELLAQLAPGSTVRFAAGNHRFSEPILVEADLTFIGAGQDETVLSTSAAGVGLTFVGPGGFTMQDLTLEHTGPSEASVMVVIEGPVAIENATIRGGVAAEDSSGGGHGIVYAYEDLPGFPERTDAEREGALTMTNSMITDNDAAGVLVNGNAEPQFDGVTISDNGAAGVLIGGTAVPVFTDPVVSGNGGCGICFTGEAVGTVTGGTIEGNDIGTQIGDSAAPRFSETRFSSNTNVGISIDGDATPTISASTIEESGDVGIQIGGSAAPVIDENTIRKHGVGVLAADSSRPTITSNGIVDHEIGVQVGGEAVVDVVDNVVWLTSGAAISYTGTSSGNIRGNQIDRATGVGIQTLGEASTQLTHNLVENAGAVGISYVEQSKGTLVGNEIVGRDVGVQLGGSSTTDLFDNTIRAATTVGMLYGDEATGTVVGNEITKSAAAGLLAGGTSSPSIEDNTLTENAVGIVLRENTTAAVSRNTIDLHGVGIQAFDDADAAVSDNSIVNSADAGVVFGGSATGTFERNYLEANGNISLQVGETAHPRVAGNEIRGEGVYGVVYRDNAGGEFRDNLVVNLVFGIQLNGSAAPRIHDNSLEEIALTNIAYADSTGGEISGNSCAQSFGAGVTIDVTADPNVGDNDCTVSRSTPEPPDTSTTTTSVPSTIPVEGCPAADGSEPQQRQFDEYHPFCINSARTYQAVVQTNLGSLTIELDPERAPLTVNNFVNLARFKYYDDTKCHRAIPDFVVQCGDPTATGTGGPGYQFPDELPEAGEYEIGSVAMANSGPNTNGSQFFLISGPDGAALPPQYSLFGTITDGLNTTLPLLNSFGNPNNNGVPPLAELVIESITIIES